MNVLFARSPLKAGQCVYLSCIYNKVIIGQNWWRHVFVAGCCAVLWLSLKAFCALF